MYPAELIQNSVIYFSKWLYKFSVSQCGICISQCEIYIPHCGFCIPQCETENSPLQAKKYEPTNGYFLPNPRKNNILSNTSVNKHYLLFTHKHVQLWKK